MDDAREADRARTNERWLQQALYFLQQQLRLLTQDGKLKVTRRLLMLLTLEPLLLESLQQTLNTLPSGWTQVLELDFAPLHHEDDCRDPPSDEALLGTATHLAHATSSFVLLFIVALDNIPTAIPRVFLERCRQLQSLVVYSCPISEEVVRAIFSVESLREVTMHLTDLSNSGSSNAFCRGMETSSLQELAMGGVLFSPEHGAEVATTLARSKTLVYFNYRFDASTLFFDHYCVALSSNYNTKLERLRLYPHERRHALDLPGDSGEASGLDAAIVAKIRNLLKWNVQRTTCPPLFAAVGNAETDATRKVCLVEAFEAVDTPVVFEYITANKDNLIELIQRLGRSRKRQHED